MNEHELETAPTESPEDRTNFQSSNNSSEPSLEALRQLIIGEEVKETIVEKAQAPELLAKNLPEAFLQREKNSEDFEQLVAAIRASTESTIRLSVKTDKEPLTKALFPIMGPAIRTYALELFRGMAEDLNRSIQSATSVEQIKWRVQAKLMGKPYSEYVLLKTQSFRVEEVYLMQRHTGLLLLHTALDSNGEVDGDADIVSGMFTAIRSFVKDSFARGKESESHEDGELDSFTFGDREVLIEVGPTLVLAAVVKGPPSPEARTALMEIHEQLHADLNPLLENFSGDTSELESARPLLRQALIESHGENSIKSKESFLPIWIILGVTSIIALSTFVVNLYEQRSWERFEKTLRSEPGLSVTEVKRTGWWRKRLVRGMRDPLATKPEMLASDLGIDSERTEFDFGLMASMDERFELARQNDLERKRENLQDQIEQLERELLANKQTQNQMSEKNTLLTEAVLQSLFTEFPGLNYQLERDSIRLWGSLSESDLAKLKKRLKPLETVRNINSSGLKNDSQAKLTQLLREVQNFSISFQEGANTNSASDLFKLLKEVNEVAEKTGASYHFTLLAHPLVGKNREANRVVERRRIETLATQLINEGFEKAFLHQELSNDMNKAGSGITIQAHKND